MTELSASGDRSSAEARVAELFAELAIAITDLVAANPSESAPVERLLTVAEAAELLRISRTTAYQVIGTGELASMRIRGRRLIPASAVDMLMTARLTEGSL